MKMQAMLCLAFLVAAASAINAQPPTYQLSVTGGTLMAGGQLLSEVSMDALQVSRGFRFRMLHDPSALELTFVDSQVTALLGAPAEFDSITTSAGSYLHVVLTSTVMPTFVLPAGADLLLTAATYEAVPGFLGVTGLDFAGTDLFVLDATLAQVTPATAGTVVSVVTGSDYTLSFGGSSLVPGGTSLLQVLLDSSGGGAIAGWSYGAAPLGGAVLVQSVAPGATTLTVQNGGPPDFQQLQLAGGGFIQVVDIDSADVFVLPSGAGAELAVAVLSTMAGFSGTVTFDFTGGLGAGLSIQPAIGAALVPDTVPLALSKSPSFLRGDGNNDGAVSISDAIFELTYLFSGGSAPDCFDAADVNDDGSVSIADAIFLLAYLFGGGPAPPGGSVCTPDTTTDALNCVMSLGC